MPNDFKNDNDLFVALKLDSKSFPGRNSGMRRTSHVDKCPPYLKLQIAIGITRASLMATYLIIIAGDVSLNPGPAASVLDSSLDSIAKSDDESMDNNCLPSTYDEYCDPAGFFNLGLGYKGLRFGHWNVNRLTSAKFDQIKLFLLKGNSPQIDVLSINETFLKPTVPNSLYSVQ